MFHNYVALLLFRMFGDTISRLWFMLVREICFGGKRKGGGREKQEQGFEGKNKLMYNVDVL
jgi:hypothetical protein